ncbi:hypothetical protein D3C72_1660120 [compost metagenome]
MKGEGLEHVGVAPRLEHAPLGGGELVRLALAQLRLGGRRAERFEGPHAAICQRVHPACAIVALRAVIETPRQEAAQRAQREPGVEGIEPAREVPRGGVEHRAVRARRQPERWLQRGVEAVVGGRRHPGVRARPEVLRQWQRRAGIGIAPQPLRAERAERLGRRQVDREARGGHRHAARLPASPSAA